MTQPWHSFDMALLPRKVPLCKKLKVSLEEARAEMVLAVSGLACHWPRRWPVPDAFEANEST